MLFFVVASGPLIGIITYSNILMLSNRLSTKSILREGFGFFWCLIPFSTIFYLYQSILRKQDLP